MLSFQRFYGHTSFGLFGNFWPSDKGDREAIGVTYADLHLGRCRIELAWKNRHWVNGCPTVAERGIW